MKRLFLTLAFILIGAALSAQEIRDCFSVSSGVVMWRKVFEASTDPGAMFKALRDKGVFVDLLEEEAGVSGRIMPVELDYKGAGYKRMGIALYIRDQRCSCYFTVDIREGRYRVTARNLVFTPKYDTGLSRMGEENPVETYALKGQGFRDVFFDGPAQSIDKTFTDLFTINAGDDDEW